MEIEATITCPLCGFSKVEAMPAQRVLDTEGPEDFEDYRRSQEALGADDVKIRGARATVSYVSGNQQPLAKVADEWYLDGSAKKPRRG